MVVYQKISKLLRFSGHCWRSKDELASDIILQKTHHGKRKCGRPANTYIDKLRNNTNLTTIDEMKTAMEDREELTNHVIDYRASPTWLGKVSNL